MTSLLDTLFGQGGFVMKMKRVLVEFTKRIDVIVYVPEDASHDDVCSIASNIAYDGLNGWDDPAWESWAGKPDEVDVPDDHCVPETRPARYGGGTYTGPKERTTFTNPDVLLMNDDRDDFVAPMDATWWRIETPSTTEDGS